MAYLVDAHVARDATEAEQGERLVQVVGLHNLTNIDQCGLILVHTARGAVVERVGLRGLTVAGSVVDRGYKTDLPARAQVVDEGRLDEDLEAVENERGACVSIEGHLTASDLVHCAFEIVKRLPVLAHEGKSDSRVWVTIAKCSHVHVERGPQVRVSVPEAALVAEASYEIVGAGDVLLDLKMVVLGLRAHTRASTRHVVHVL